MCSLINKQLLLTAYAYLFIMEQQKAQGGSEALQLQVESTQANYVERPALTVTHGNLHVGDIQSTLPDRLIRREKNIRQLAKYWKCGPFCPEEEIAQHIASSDNNAVSRNIAAYNAEVRDAMDEFLRGNWKGEESGRSEFFGRGEIVTKMELAILKEKYLSGIFPSVNIPETNTKLQDCRIKFLATPILNSMAALAWEDRDGAGLSPLVDTFQVDRLKFRLGISYNSWEGEFNEEKVMGGTYEDHGILRENSWRPKQSFLGEEGSCFKI